MSRSPVAFIAALAAAVGATLALAQAGGPLEAGKPIRVGGGAGNPLAPYGLGEYVFERCAWPTYGAASANMSRLGASSTGAVLQVALDGGSRWLGMARGRLSVSASAQVNLLPGPAPGVWKGGPSTNPILSGGYTVWLRVGHELVREGDQYFAGVGRSNSAGNCNTLNGERWSTPGPSGVFFTCSVDGGFSRVCRFSDAGVPPTLCETLVGTDGGPGEFACEAGRGFDIVLRNAGGGADAVEWFVQELETDVTARGTIEHPEDPSFIWTPIWRGCSQADGGVMSLAGMCASTNY